VWSEVLSQWKIPMKPSGIEPRTSGLQRSAQQTAPHARKYNSYQEGDFTIGKADVALFVGTVSKG